MIDYRSMVWRGCSLVVALLLVWGATSEALAQQNPPQAGPAAPPSKPAAQPAPPVGTDQALYLVRSTLLTLNDANRSGNYTVLRDLAAPDFQTRNTAADLAQAFSDLRQRKFDLFAAALLAPQFTPAPALDADGKLHLTGFFPTRPLRINFDLIFQSVGGQWRLFAISIATPSAPAEKSQVNPPSPRHPPGLLYGFRWFSGTAGVRW